MKLRESDIFNSYAKFAKENGMISEAALKKTAAEKDEVSSAEVLYGIKPNGKEDDKTLAEKAHPDTFAVGPAYDAMNAVVENLYQRQDIMAHIALKMPDGQLINRRYVAAQKDLLKNLISIGFDMDNRDEISLMKIADDCAERLTKKAALPALLAPVVGIGAGIAALVALDYYFLHAAPDIQNIDANSKIVLNELDDLSSKTYTTALKDLVSHIQSLNAKLFSNLQVLSSEKRKIITAFSTNNIKEISNIQKNNAGLVNSTKTLINQLNATRVNLSAFKDDIEGERDGGNLPDWMKKFKNISDMVIGNDDDDVIKAIDSLVGAITKATANASNVISSVSQKYEKPIQDHVNDVTEQLNSQQKQQQQDLADQELEQAINS